MRTSRVWQNNRPRCPPGRRHQPRAPDPGGEPLCMPLCFWATQTVVAASGLFVGAGRSNLTPYLPPHSAASRIQLAYRSYIRRVSRHNNPLSLCYSLTFPSASCAVVARSIVLSNRRTKSTSNEKGMIGMWTLFAMDWTLFTGNATKGTLRWMRSRNWFAVHWTSWLDRTTPASPFGY